MNDKMKRIENTIVKGYEKIEDTVVGTYEKIEDKFTLEYLTRNNETLEEAKERLKEENKERRGNL